MTYANSTDFRRALQHRLRNEAASRPGYTVQRIRKQLVFERFAARLAHVQPDGWIAKGGAVLEFRLRERARTTQDIDLAAEFDADTVAELMLKAATVDLGDWFSFRMERVRALQDDDGVLAVRFRLTAIVDGHRFEIVPVDVGIGAPLPLQPDFLVEPSLIEFADVAPVRLPTIPLPEHLAEKLHAYVRIYAGGRPSSRVKDLIDIILIITDFQLVSTDVTRAIGKTFHDRGAQELPKRLPEPPSFWIPVYQDVATEIGIETDVMAGYRIAAAFFDPLLADSAGEGARWMPPELRWQAQMTQPAG